MDRIATVTPDKTFRTSILCLEQPFLKTPSQKVETW